MPQKLNWLFGHSLSVPTFGGHFQYYMLISIKQIKRYDVIQWLEAENKQSQACDKVVYFLKEDDLLQSSQVVIGSLPEKAL